MTALFLVAFLAGLLVLVYSMLHGVERPVRELAGSPATASPISAPPASATSSRLPMTGAFAAVLGATGYLLVRYTTLRPIPLLAIAAIAGVLGALGALALVAKWAVPGALAEPVDERYLLQGQFAMVTSAIDTGATGVIQYEEGGAARTLDARSVDGSPLRLSTEVVIDRVEDGVAYVEPWSLVEQRI